MTKLSFIKLIPSEDQMLEFGAELALTVGNSAVIFLVGNLGAGKTTLTRGFLRGIGYEGKVKSPTYTIVEPYEVDGKIVYHFDFYRLKDPEELEYIGVKDYFTSNTISLIEWPDQGGQLLPVADLSCYIESHSEGREVRIEAHTSLGLDILKRLINLEAE